jgi:hypothetical protein
MPTRARSHAPRDPIGASPLDDAMPTRATRVACAVALGALCAPASALKLAETFDDGALAGWTRSSEAKYTGARRATRRSRKKTPIAMDERLRRDSMAEKTRDDARTIGTRARGRTRGRGKTRGGAGEGRAGVEARAEGREGDARGETEIRDRASASDGDGTGIDDGGTTAVDGTKRASRCVTDSNDRWFRAM